MGLLRTKQTDTIVTAGDMSGNITSNLINIPFLHGYAVQAVWSAGSSPVGTLKLQGSVDNVNFSDITDASQAVSGNSGSVLFNMVDQQYPYAQLVYTRTSGSGTLDAKVYQKGNS